LLNRHGEPHLQTPPLYAPDEAPRSGRGGPGGLPLGASLPEPAPLPALAPTLPSSREAAAQDLPELPAAASIPVSAAPTPISAAPTPVSAVDWERIKRFKNKLQEECMETCSRCNVRWFQMGLATQGDDIGVCKPCIKDAKSLNNPTLPLLFSDANELDPGLVPEDLPILTGVEEIMIARVYVHLQVIRVRGQQHRYTGHVCSFSQNTPKTWKQLPRLPEELDILVVKPAAADGEEHLNRRFNKRYTVRRSAIEQWLRFLKINHPDYRDVEISSDRLERLPQNGSILTQLRHINESDADSAPPRDPPPASAVDPPPAELGDDILNGVLNEDNVLDTLVPDLVPDTDELELLMREVQHQQYLQQGFEVPSVDERPISERTASCIMRGAFPTLFPYGKADFDASRTRSVTLAAYAKHMLKYKDGRFGRHPLFRYYVFNRIMRDQALSATRFLCNQSDESRLSLDELNDLIGGNRGEQFLNKIVRHARKIKGTRPYWRQMRNELTAYAENIDKGSLFFTLSAADLQWYDLHAHMPQFNEYKAADETQRYRIASRNLNENPHIAAYWLHRRFDLFKKYVLMDLFDCDDFWFRFEWQLRGSGHIHGFLWSSSAPKPDPSSDELRATFAEYWAAFVSALNPDQYRRPDIRHPSSLSYDEQRNTVQFLSACLNRFQRHSRCSESYCLRAKKGSNEAKQCRFYFPRRLRVQAAVTKDQNPKHWTFCPERNDKILNNYNPATTIGWMANTDTSPATSVSAIVNYIGKYCSKEEKKSTSYKELLQTVQPYANELHAFSSIVAKFMNKLIAERDWSAQEVCHLLLDIPLCEGSRQIVTLDCRQHSDRSAAYELDDGQLTRCGRSNYDKYKDRPDEAEDVTFLDFLLHYDHSKYRRRPRAKPQVISYFPRYKGQPSSPQYADFCRVKLLLHHPWREYEDIATHSDEFGALDYVASYQACAGSHQHPSDYFYNEDLEEVQQAANDVDEFEDNFVDDLELYQSFEALHARVRNTDGVEIEDPDKLGDRELDREYDWIRHQGTYPQLDEKTYWRNERLQPLPERLLPAATPSSLQSTQRNVYDAVVNHYRQVQSDFTLPKPLRINIDGEAGTGKSHLIAVLSSTLSEMASSRGKPSPLARAAPTGVAAFNINGRTTYELLKLPVQRPFEDLPSASLAPLQQAFKDIHYLVLDEKSMIGQTHLGWIDCRLRQIFPTRCGEYFGGLSVLLVGDFHQLPPVGQTALYSDLPTHPSELGVLGKGAYQAIDRTAVLDRVMRQGGNDAESAAFRSALTELRSDTVGDSTWRLLLTRCRQNLTPDKVAKFDDAIRLYGTRAAVGKYNHDRLRDLRRPVVAIKSIDSGVGAAKATHDQCEIMSNLTICIGAKVMLIQNIWVELGLVNGTTGTIKDIIWKEGADVKKDPPQSLLIAVDKYDGPALFTREDGKKVVPIFPVLREWEGARGTCSRRQFAAALAFAITVHKSQGLTLEWVVLDIKDKDKTPGLTYVAISRVKKLSGI